LPNTPAQTAQNFQPDKKEKTIMLTASRILPTTTDTGQLLPSGFDPGNGSAKLIVNGTEIRIPSLIAPLHNEIYEVPQSPTGSLITYRSGSRSDLIGQRWFVGSSAYIYSPNGHQRIVDDRKGKIKFSLQLLFGALSALPYRQVWKLGLMLSIQDAQAFSEELFESVVGQHDIGINDNPASTQVEIKVLGVKEEGQGAIAQAASTAVIDIKTQNILIDIGHGTIITSVFGIGGKLIARTVTPGGVSALIEAIAKNINTRRQLAKEGDRQIIRQGVESKSAPFEYGTTGWNFRSVYASELKPWVSQNLATALKSVDDWRETSAAIIAIGGGSMLPAISQLLTLQGISTLDDGCWANARGLARLAQLKLRRVG
jgi:hypothetical protein